MLKKVKQNTLTIFGDFFGVGDVKDIEEALIGVQHQKSSIQEALKDIDVYHYFGDIAKEEIINLML